MRCCCADWISRLARDHAGKLAAIARHEGVGAADALDVVQDAFQTLMARPDAVALREANDDDGAARLLSTIVRNGARNARRRHHHAREHVDIAELGLAASDVRADDAIDRAETAQQLVGCMAKLGDAHRHVVTLRVLEELSGDEAAATLGLTTGHVAVLLHRARKQLERCMTSEAGA